MAIPSRRRFLSAMGAFAAIAPKWALGFEEPSSELTTHRRVGRALGSSVSITVAHSAAEEARSALEAAFAELELIESLLSVYRETSQVSRLNRVGQLTDPHPYLLEVLGEAQRVSRLTEGAFDITVQPLWSLFAEAKQEGRLPTDAEVLAARSTVDWRNVHCGQGQVNLAGGARITLNGIAQGFATDCVMRALRSAGIRHALVDAGELGSIGQKRPGAPWKVGIQHPRVEDAFVRLAVLAGRSLSTSGDYATTFSPDLTHNHLFDPRTGKSPGELASVSIAADSSMLADALSTAVFVLGEARGRKLVREIPEVDALLVSKDGRVSTTAGFPTA